MSDFTPKDLSTAAGTAPHLIMHMPHPSIKDNFSCPSDAEVEQITRQNKQLAARIRGSFSQRMTSFETLEAHDKAHLLKLIDLQLMIRTRGYYGGDVQWTERILRQLLDSVPPKKLHLHDVEPLFFGGRLHDPARSVLPKLIRQITKQPMRPIHATRLPQISLSLPLRGSE